MKKPLSLLAAAAVLLSGFAGFAGLAGQAGLTVEAAGEQRLNAHTRYAYSFPAPQNVAGDSLGTLLTDGKTDAFATVTVKNRTQWVKDWYGKEHTLDLFLEGKDPHFYIQNDFGFPAQVTGVSAAFSTADGAVLPKGADVFVTDDGYNYVRYPAQSLKKTGTTLDIRFDKAVTAKGVKVLFYTDLDTKAAIGELSVYGTPNENPWVLLSKGAKYRWSGTQVSGYTADKDGTLLTDGVVAAPGDKAHMTARGVGSGDKDPISHSEATVIDLDLRAQRNISDVGFLAYTAVNPDYITVKYSTDGKAFRDMGQSWRLGQFGSGKSTLTDYRVTLGHTVKARYLKISVVGKAILSEIEVYGSQKPVAEPDYGFTQRDEVTANTNIAPSGKVKVGARPDNRLNDENYLNFETLRRGKKTEITLEFDKAQPVCGLLLYCLDNGTVRLPRSVKTFVSADGRSFAPVAAPLGLYTMASRGIYRQYFDSTPVKKVKFEVEAAGDADAGVLEVCAYSGQPQLPIYRGGFFQINCLDYNFEHAVIKNSEQMWYTQLKGMKELGMDYAVIIAGADYTNKRMNIPSPRLAKKGYKMTTGLGCADPYRAILEAAQKLGMKVYIGTVITHGSKQAIMDNGGLSHAEKVLEDDHALIQDIEDLYGRYTAFAGYYFPNETCDQWLNEPNGPELYRTLYATQAAWIHQLAPGRKILIAPAVWRAGDPVKNGDLVYNLVKPGEDGKPAVDIVAPQDCLGREPTLEVAPYTFNVYEQHLQEWAKGARRAGAAFWADAEVFEATYHPKRYKDDIHGLELQAKLTNCIINFDTPHYFSEIAQGALNSWWRFDMSATLSAYAKRCATQFAAADDMGRHPRPLAAYTMKPAVYTMDFEPFPADPDDPAVPEVPDTPDTPVMPTAPDTPAAPDGEPTLPDGTPAAPDDTGTPGGAPVTDADGSTVTDTDGRPVTGAPGADDTAGPGNGGGLSTAAIVCLAVCGVLVAAFAAVEIGLLVRRRKAAPAEQPAPESPSPESAPSEDTPPEDSQS